MSGNWFRTDCLYYVDMGFYIPWSQRTRWWEVRSTKDQRLMGIIKWYRQWRKYCFFPETGVILDPYFLLEIAETCQRLTKEYNEKRGNKT